MTKFIALFSFLVLSSQSFGIEKNDPYYRIKEISVQNLGTFTELKATTPDDDLQQTGTNLVYVIDQLIAVGKSLSNC